MTVLYGNLRDVTGAPFDQQGTAVVISATQARPAMHSDALTLVELARVEMEDSDGHFETPELDPGPVIVRLEGGVSHGQQWEIGIPDDNERWNLADLIGEQVEWEPIVVSRAEAAARESRAQADRSEREADRSERAADRVGSAERVLEAEATAVQAEKDALSHRDESARQATRSESEADRAADEATAAAESAGHASASAAAAADSEDEAGKSQVAAAGSAESAAGSATLAEQHRDDADVHRRAAADSATAAKTSEDNAASSATNAAISASEAEERVTDAVAEATGITAGHADAAQASSERSARSARDARASQQAAAESAEAAAEIAIGNVPGATEDTRGLIQLGGDLSGTADAPTVPALSLAAPGASVQLTPQEPGWGYATAPVADTPTGWSMDGTWVSPPHWMSSVMVMVDWCGGTSVALRGRRSDGSAVTLETVPAGTPETHRPVTVRVELADISGLAVAATWSPEDLEADCTVSLLVVPLPKHSHPISEVEGLQGALQSKVNGNDDRLSDPRMPLPHEHEVDQVRGLRAVVDRLDALEALVRGRPVEWEWDGTEPWVPPEHALPGDRVWNTDSNDVHRAEEVISDE
ncbi:hypothetical protein [Corynebacterium sp.]|uniref:hypothetical protein n=1 Tax=Corynebacterium sp. TaxID=1720 RepID=UPI0025BF8923|nr:hypothetical protein [Corynebacterium sp.]